MFAILSAEVCQFSKVKAKTLEEAGLREHSPPPPALFQAKVLTLAGSAMDIPFPAFSKPCSADSWAHASFLAPSNWPAQGIAQLQVLLHKLSNPC